MSISLITGSTGSGHVHLWKELRAAQQAAQDSTSSSASVAGTATTLPPLPLGPSQSVSASASSDAAAATSTLSDASSKLVAGLNAFLIGLQQDGSSTATASNTTSLAGPTSVTTPFATTGRTGAPSTTATAASLTGRPDPLQTAADELAAQLSSVIGSYTAQAGGTTFAAAA